MAHASADASWEEAWADPSFLEALIAAAPPAATGPSSALAARHAAPHLPQDVLSIIFAHCESATLLACAAGVCRQWRAAVAAADVRPWAKHVLRGVPAGCARALRAARFSLLAARCASGLHVHVCQRVLRRRAHLRVPRRRCPRII
jgi:hypothetical protein